MNYVFATLNVKTDLLLVVQWNAGVQKLRIEESQDAQQTQL